MKIKYLFYLLLISVLTTGCNCCCSDKTVYIDMPNTPAHVKQKNPGAIFEPLPQARKKEPEKQQTIAPTKVPVIKRENLTPKNYTNYSEEKIYDEVIYSGNRKITIKGRSSAHSSGNGRASAGVNITVRKN